MLQLIYMSTAQTPPSPDEMADLCRHAARNNARDEITGVLLAYGSRFLQALEGPKEQVEDTFLRIMVDGRHHSLLLLRRKMTTTREFGDWSMATCDAPEERGRIVERVRAGLASTAEHVRRQFESAFPPDEP